MKKFIILAISLAILGGGVMVATPAFASDQSAQDTLVSRIASRFNLNQADVQSVFDQFRTDRANARETKYEDYLTKLVQQGKITSDQKTLLINKRKELLDWFQSERSNWKNTKPTDRKSQVDAKLQDLKTWSDQNHIDIKYLIHGGGNKMFRLGFLFGRKK